MSQLGGRARRIAKSNPSDGVKFVNAEPGVGYGGRKHTAERNCAVCTAAGALNLMFGRQVFDTEYLLNYGINIPIRIEAGGSIPNQIAGITACVLRFAPGKTVQQYGDGANEQPYAGAAVWMAGQPNGTAFAVYVSGPLVGDPGGGNKSHWLNAKKNPDGLVFFDFQSCRGFDKAGNAPSGWGGQIAATCSVPFVGIITQNEFKSSGGQSVTQDLRSPTQEGALDTNSTNCVVIAFRPA